MTNQFPQRGPASRRRILIWRKSIPLILAVALACPWPGAATAAIAAGDDSSKRGLDPIRGYISNAWDTLTRSLTKCATVVDPKLQASSVLYIPADFPVPESVSELQKQCSFQVLHLPKVIHGPGEIDSNKIDPQGLLYLPNSYVVPGGRFNEMYGWDSYFIIRGLVSDGRIDLARGMVENFFFEIEHYGTILNANRSYYLTRSQPPFLTSMILAVYDAQKAAGREDRAWLEKAYGYAAKDYAMWVREPHLAGSTGLSRYYDFGDGPTPESVKDETGYYRKVTTFFLLHPAQNDGYVVVNNEKNAAQPILGREYTVQVCDAATTMARPDCEPSVAVSLSADYYKGDRAMRESGYDISFRFGPFSAATHHYAPVCLNSLLYKTETDLEEMSRILGRAEEAEKWHARAEDRKEKIQKYLWDGQRGLFFDYDFEKQTRSSYDFLTTFFPLWAGLATPEQARAVVQNIKIFEQPGGLAMSAHESEGQWDFPYEWAPDQLPADEGMRRYGFNDEANKTSYEFLSTVAENFRRDGTIREKYDAVTRSSETHVTAGYHENVVGFGWTNGVFLVLLHELPPDWVKRLAKEQDAPLPAAK
ncbi:MAG: trehalase family glycosidase [Candidatus Acidiferrales bacterium]